MDNGVKNTGQQSARFLFDATASPNFNKAGTVFLETKRGWAEKISSVFASLFLWFKCLNSKKPEGEQARHIRKLIKTEGKISEYEKVAFKIMQPGAKLGKTIADNDYKSWKEELIKEAVSLVSGLANDEKKYYQSSILDMMAVMDNAQEHPEIASDVNRIFQAHNASQEGPFVGAGSQTILADDGEPLVKKFQAAIASDLERFRKALYEIRKDIREYQSLDKCLHERPSLGDKLEVDTKELIASCNKLMSNPAFKKYGWETDLTSYLSASFHQIKREQEESVLESFQNNLAHSIFFVGEEPSIRGSGATQFFNAIKKLTGKEDLSDAMKCCSPDIWSKAASRETKKSWLKFIEERVGKELGIPVSLKEDKLLPKVNVPDTYYKIHKNSTGDDLVFVAEKIFKVTSQEPPTDRGYLIARMTIDRATGRMNVEHSHVVKHVPVIEDSMEVTDLSDLNKRWAVDTTAQLTNEIFQTIGNLVKAKQFTQDLSGEEAKYHKSALEGILRIVDAISTTPPDAAKLCLAFDMHNGRGTTTIFEKDNQALNSFVSAFKENMKHTGFDKALLLMKDKIDRNENLSAADVKDFFRAYDKLNASVELEKYGWRQVGTRAFADTMKMRLAIDPTSPDLNPNAIKKILEIVEAVNDGNFQSSKIKEIFKLEDKYDSSELLKLAQRVRKNMELTEFDKAAKIMRAGLRNNETPKEEFTREFFRLFETVIYSSEFEKHGWGEPNIQKLLATAIIDPAAPKSEIPNIFVADIHRQNIYFEDPDNKATDLKNRYSLSAKTIDSEKENRIRFFKQSIAKLMPNKPDAISDAMAIANQAINSLVMNKLDTLPLLKALRTQYDDARTQAGIENRIVIAKKDDDLSISYEIVLPVWSAKERVFDATGVPRDPETTEEYTIGYIVTRVTADRASDQMTCEFSEMVNFRPKLSENLQLTDLKKLERYKPPAVDSKS